MTKTLSRTTQRYRMQNTKCSLAVAVETLGCKVNQYETSYFLGVLKQAGYRIVLFS